MTKDQKIEKLWEEICILERELAAGAEETMVKREAIEAKREKIVYLRRNEAQFHAVDVRELTPVYA